jgi:hypothetical protein
MTVNPACPRHRLCKITKTHQTSTCFKHTIPSACSHGPIARIWLHTPSHPRPKNPSISRQCTKNPPDTPRPTAQSVYTWRFHECETSKQICPQMPSFQLPDDLNKQYPSPSSCPLHLGPQANTIKYHLHPRSMNRRSLRDLLAMVHSKLPS